jgi:hypothetical protein
MTAPPRSRRARRLAVRIVAAAAVALLVLALLELAVRAFWVDQYDLPGGSSTVTVLHQQKPTRLHAPRLQLTMRADGIYTAAGAVRFRTDARSALLAASAPAHDRFDRGVAVALGGSTTECALVPEGQRWPDLLPQPAVNFGVSGNTSMHSLRSLVALLPLLPRRVYVMHAYNDLLALTRRGDALDLAAYESGSLDLYAAERPTGWVGQSRLFRLLTHLRGELVGRFYLAHYQALVAAQSVQPWLEERDFEQLLALVPSALLPQRTVILEEMARLCAAANVELLLLTQPHAYAAAGLEGPDLRTSFVWREHRLTFAQCARLLDAVNDHTRSVGDRLGVRVVDVARGLAGRDVSSLFYDQVHYTPEGCRVLADLLR